MYYIREGFPEESEVVLCTVTKILPHSVFVRLDDYTHSGMIHISEIAPGRIRNMNDYVTIGKKIVCKVLSVRSAQGHIDLSLRRVSEGQRREKSNQLKKEQKAEKLIENLAKSIKRDPKELYSLISKPVLNDYVYVHECFEDIVNGEVGIQTLKLPADIEKLLLDLIKQRMEPPDLSIQGVLTLETYAGDGIEKIKHLFSKLKDKDISCKYLGGGKFKVIISGKDYGVVEKKYEEKITKNVELFINGGGEANFART